jgi:glutamate 5-kinase
MITKLVAAKTAAKDGVDMVLANGSEPSILINILDGEEVGTLFLGKNGVN